MKALHIIGILVVLIIIIGGTVVLTNKGPAQTASKEPIKIGSILPLTGEAAEVGLRAQESINLALEEINAQGGINGQKLEVVFEDSKCDARASSDAATKLISFDRVHIIIGGLCSGETLGAAPVAEQNKVVVLSPCSSAPKITQAGDYIFRDYPSDTFQGSFGAEYVYNKLGVRKVAILHTIGDWGNGIKDVFKQRFIELGGQIVAEESFEQSATDMRTQLTKIKAANPELIYMPAYSQGAGLILKQAKELGINAKFLDGDGGDDPNVIKVASDASEGFQVTVAASGSDSFAQKFKAKFGHEPLVCTTYSYDAVNILSQVLKKTENNGEAIKNELYKIKDYKGETGSISLDSNGDRTTAEYVIKEVRNGQFRVINQNQPKVKIGFIGPLTGEAAVYGLPLQNMIKLAAEEINAEGNLEMEIIYEDSKCNGKDSATAMQKLVSVDNVKVVLGGFCSSESLGAEPIATQNKVFLFSLGSSSPALTGKSKFFARDYPSDATQGRVLAEVAYNNKNWKKVAFIQEQLDYPLGIYNAFSARFKELGGMVVKEEFATGTTDFRSILTKLKAENPDALFVDTQTPAPAERILKQLGELNWKPNILVSDAVSGDLDTVKRNAATLEGALAAEFGIDENNPKFKHMLEAYKAKYGTDAPYLSYAQTVYDGVYIIRDAIKAVGYDGEKISEFVRSLKDWDGASGKVTIRQDGDRVGGHVPKVIVNGTVVLYK